MTKLPRCLAFSCAALLLACSAALAQAPLPVQPQAPVEAERAPAFRAVAYEVRASLAPAEQSLTAQATVEFEAREASSFLQTELHPNLRISGVRNAAGERVDYERDFANPLLVRVTLPAAVPAGERLKLTFDYSGSLPNEQNSSPISGTRVAWIGSQGAYLLLPGRWFPLTDFPSNRFTGVFQLEVPDNFAVVGTGSSVAPSVVQSPPPPPVLGNRNPNLPPLPNPDPPPPPPAAPRYLYTFRVDRPQAAGTFVAGALQLSPVQAEGLNLSVYAPAAASGTASAYGEAVARIVGVYSAQFGPLPQPHLTVAQIPDGTVAGFAAPGLLLVSQRHWTARPDTRLLASLAASQWWGDQVMAASPSDVWLTDGLARYSEAIYVEQTAGRDGMNRALEDYAVGALMYEDAAPISEAGRLAPLTAPYLSVVVNKGAMVFHMLRARLGDAAFFSLLRDFYFQFSNKQARITDFERMADERAAAASRAAPPPDNFAIRIGSDPPANSDASAAAESLRPFFAQWLRSTGVPEFTVDYTVFRIPRGFRIVGKIKQELDVFRAPVEIEVQTEGNPELKTLEVSGTESDFEIEVFGRPKAGGIVLDPHDYILKSSPRLRVRAIIARGEALAEQSRFYDAIQQYAQALDLQRNHSLAQFRMGEVFFYQKNYQAAANAFRGALDGDVDPADKWVQVWSHIYLGKIFDISGDRTRAVNEYSRAEQTNDDTGGAQEEVKKYLAAPYTERPG